MNYNSRGFVLRQRDYRDSDKLLNIFTEQKGKITAIAKGIKKPKSSLRACAQPFCHAELHLHQGREIDLLTQARMLDFYAYSRSDLERSLYCIYLMELLDKSLMENTPLPDLYQALLLVLTAINEEGLNLLFIRYFEARLLDNLGYKPVLYHCISCQQQAEASFCLSLSEGGLVCPACQESGHEGIKVSGETMGLLRLLSEGSFQILSRVKASPGGLRELEELLEKYLTYHLDRRFKMKNTIRLLKKTIHFEN
ncbi:MAG TPA: DNA repair protein RecO [Syntrophomonas sp.]|nr:DNA repair protein RecO [Syntrophomonas sp.]